MSAFMKILFGPQKPNLPFSPRQIRAPQNFFNRTKEAELVSSKLNPRDGEFFVVTGPPNCGKTALLSKVLSDPERRVVRLNLRLATWGSFANLYGCMSSQDAYYFSGLGLEGNAGIALDGTPEASEKLVANVALKPNNKPTPSDFTALLNKLSDYIVAGSGPKSKMPVFWIDEANYLKAYSKEDGCDMDSDNALQTLLTWGLAHSKEQNDFHVVLSSSESWFHNFLHLKGRVMQFATSLAISDISKEEAHKYYEHLLEENKGLLPPGLPTPFDNVFAVYGGRMVWIRKHVQKAIANQSFPDPLSCDSISEAERVFAHACSPTKFRTSRDSVAQYGTPEWTKKNLITAMKLLVETNGCVDARKMDSKVPEAAIASMVNHNLFSFLPTTEAVPSLPSNSGSAFIPSFPQHLIAMKRVLKKI